MQALATTKTVVQTIIENILNGMTLRDAISQQGITPYSFQQALAGDKQLATAYARAVEIKADLMADDVVHIADTDEDAARARNRMQARQWLASKLYAQRYGDRIDLNVSQTIDIGSTLAEARARLLPVRDQHELIDAQAIDISRQNDPKPRDNESLMRPDSPALPDIFS